MAALHSMPATPTCWYCSQVDPSCQSTPQDRHLSHLQVGHLSLFFSGPDAMSSMPSPAVCNGWQDKGDVTIGTGCKVKVPICHAPGCGSAATLIGALMLDGPCQAQISWKSALSPALSLALQFCLSQSLSLRVFCFL
eukprot:82962-Pelagomonas_calceolata.AAC.3